MSHLFHRKNCIGWLVGFCEKPTNQPLQNILSYKTGPKPVPSAPRPIRRVHNLTLENTYTAARSLQRILSESNDRLNQSNSILSFSINFSDTSAWRKVLIFSR